LNGKFKSLGDRVRSYSNLFVLDTNQRTSLVNLFNNLNISFWFQLNSQRLHPLTRSNTVGGHTRGSIRGSGLPPGAPRPPGDNIYEWLHSSEQQPLSRTNNSALSVKSDKYIVISGPAGRGLYSPDPGPYSPDRGHYSPSRIPYSPDRGHYSPDRAPYSPDKGDYGPGKECLRLDNDNFSDTYVRFDIKENTQIQCWNFFLTFF